MTKLATNPVSTPKVLLSPRETAEAMGISERKLWSITFPRGSLRPVRIGTRCLYSPASIQKFISEQEAQSAQEASEGAALV